jgi:hypothetical protein
MPFSVDLIRRNAARVRRLRDRLGAEPAIPGKELWGVRGGGATMTEAPEELVSTRMEMEIETLTKGRGLRVLLGLQCFWSCMSNWEGIDKKSNVPQGQNHRSLRAQSCPPKD